MAKLDFLRRSLGIETISSNSVCRLRGVVWCRFGDFLCSIGGFVNMTLYLQLLSY